MLVPTELLFSTDEPWLPKPSEGRFAATPDELCRQLIDGSHNPGYSKAKTPEVALEWLASWRKAVLECETARIQDTADYPGFHLTNSLAKVALHPARTERFSLKEVYRAEERRFPRQKEGRDPEELSLLYHSLRSLVTAPANQ